MMKSSHADIVNSSKVRGAHAIQGAAFLSYFVTHPFGPDSNARGGADSSALRKQGKKNDKNYVAWAHLDIAGVASTESETPLISVGPTAFGTRLLAHALLD